ncbi:LOW QUALITY PROTEIN: hypothetical protein OSB04_028578 [Centaurea solstitialis]|uniref:Integrase catalytic domain-containing protein n=1 Tax=Centaurea solstitialis TaxID=347529 RepID=A0AA38W0R8_9ASTR|nr:LOW QUALITY PROTEIN: hypothetical protein OSB04_028578 [Centaurea solstitialis]
MYNFGVIISKRSKDIEDQTYLWHCRLGHINKKRVELLLKGGFLGTFDFKPFDNCESYLFGKMTKEPFNKNNERASDFRYGYVYLMRHKSESFEKFREYQNEVQNQLDRKIKFLRLDRGGEYLSQEFGNHLMECGIVSQLTPSYTPQMNGVSERRNRTLLVMVRSMMCHSTLPVSFWGHALETAAHILNRAPTKSVEKTPYKLWKGKKPKMVVTNLPQHYRAVGRKWVFKKKTDMDGNVHIFKARLVTKEFTQTHGIDYDETFSPIAMLKSIRILMANLQMDVKTAFLNGKLTEDVYMEQPEGFEDPENPNKVCKLLKSIYGLKQESRSWNLLGHFSGSIVTFLALYVDDILQSVKSWLSKCFQMKDLGEAAYILGIKIYRNRSKRLIGLSQSTYIDKILKKFRMDESKKGFIPMQHGIVSSKTQCPASSQDQDKMKSVPYASAIGSIMYAMLCNRPDVAYSVSVTSRYQQNLGEPHWVAVKNILKYLRRTKDMFLVFGGSEDEISVTGYSDARYVFTLNGGAISWKSSKQDTIADSTTEAQYIATSDAAKEAVWQRNFLSDLRVVASVSRPIDIFCDNSGAVVQAKEPREHHKSRHVLRKYHLIERSLEEEIICKIPTEDNVADPLTKPLARVKHEAHASSIGMQYLDTSS